MIRALFLLPLLWLATCAQPAAPAPSTARAAAEQACSNQIYSDADVSSDLAKSAGTQDWQWQHSGQFGEIEQTKQDAITKCLRSRGLASKGGVERRQ